MMLFLETVNIIAILLMLFMLAIILKQQSSKVQTAFILYNVFTTIFVVGVHLELNHSDTVGEALAGLCVQYVGQAGLLMSLLWFVSEFAKFSIPVWIYGLEAVCNAFVLVGIFTAEKHSLFYSSMKILTDGMYNRIEVGHGILWYIHYAHLDIVVLMIMFLCAVRYKKSTPLQKKRILYIAVGIGVQAAILFLKRTGVFGSYNPIVIAMVFTILCLMTAIVRYGYFDSFHAAVDNAFNHGNEGLIILDGEDTIIFANHKMDELFPDIHKGGAINSYQEIIKLMVGDEHLLHIDSIVYELRIEDIIEHGEKNGCMLWFVDQTQPFLTMQKLKEADEAKTQFLMKVSHELRTPMNTMLGMNEIILRESSEEEIKSYAKEVASAGANMMFLIDEILDASRLESGTLTIVRSPYQIKEVLKEAEKLMRPQAEKKGLVFTVEAEDSLTAENKFQIGDSVRILQVLVNLLSNAIKYTNSGFVSLKAEMRTELDSRRLVFSVSDSGIGIHREELTQIFENFGRGSNTGGKDGLGLGLAIVKQLTEVMGGTLIVESEPGKGSVFAVSLIWTEASEEEIAVWKKKEQENEKSVKREEKKDLPDFRTKTILAVDDNDHNLIVLKHLLKRTKVVIETASDGKTAVEACIRRKYDLILLDCMMPEMDGVAALHQIREGKNGKNQDTKVIALTANAGKGAEQTYLSEGFADYIPKPINPEKLEQALRCYLAVEKKEDMLKTEDLEKGIPTEIGWMEQLERNGISAQEGLRYADMDAAFYRELLTLFVRKQKKQKSKLDDIHRNIIKQQNAALWNEWIASCHGLKGEAIGLGASTLSGYFYQLELAGRTRDKEKIEKIYPLAAEEWEKAANDIRSAIEEPLLS